MVLFSGGALYIQEEFYGCICQCNCIRCKLKFWTPYVKFSENFGYGTGPSSSIYGNSLYWLIANKVTSYGG